MRTQRLRIGLHGTILTSTMRNVKVDRSQGVALHEQVAAQIRRAVADGEAQPGARLPPAADLAAVVGVNKNTVLRALRLLRDEGLLDFKRGRGVHVAGRAPDAAIVDRARELVHLSRHHGYRREKLVQIIQAVE